MSRRGPVAGILTGLVLTCGLLLALAGCFGLGVSGLVIVAGASGLAAALAVGFRGSEGSAAVHGALAAAGWTATACLLIAGVAALAGGVVAAVTVGVAAIVLAAGWLVRARGGGALLGRRPARSSAAPPAPSRPPYDPRVPASVVPTAELGREWLRTTAVLTNRLDLATRQLIVRRRSEVLDELERRDLAGFSRWLVRGSATGSDPADFVRPGPGHCADAA
jgi:hypothetical protein